MDILHRILLGTTLVSLGFAVGVLLLAHYKIKMVKFDYDMLIGDAECEIQKARRAMKEALEMKATYEMAGEALRGEQDYFDG